MRETMNFFQAALSGMPDGAVGGGECHGIIKM